MKVEELNINKLSLININDQLADVPIYTMIKLTVINKYEWRESKKLEVMNNLLLHCTWTFLN